MAHSVCIYTMGSISSTLTVSVFVFITYSWHPTRTGSAAPGFGKKEQAVDEQVSLTHLHGSTRKNKKERVGIAKGKKKREREEWRVPLDAVCNAAGRLPAPLPQSSRHASPADSALWKKEKEGRNLSNVSDTWGTGISGLSSRIFEPCFHTRDFSGVPRGVLNMPTW